MLVFFFAQVSNELRFRAIKEKADKDNFIALAEQVEEFTLRFLDPLKHSHDSRVSALKPELDLILETAMRKSERQQKKVTIVLFIQPRGFEVFVGVGFFLYQFRFLQFFEHPVVDRFLSERWHTTRGRTWKVNRHFLWFFLNIWCLVDVLLFPLSFLTALILGNANSYFF